jgi:hypothetical protein
VTQNTLTQTGVRTWAIDSSHSEVAFSVRHMMVSSVEGRFMSFRGDLVYDHSLDQPAGVMVEIDAGSVETGQIQRDIHLRSGDFLDVENFPHIRFASREVEPLGNGDYRVSGDELVFARTLAREGRLGFWRWLSMFLGIAGTYVVRAAQAYRAYVTGMVVAADRLRVVSAAGIAGGWVMAVPVRGGTTGAFLASFNALAQLPDFWMSTIKAAVFGYIAAAIACHYGYHAFGGPKAVGDAVNRAVVLTFVILFFVNFVMTALYFNIVPPKF